MGLLALVWVLAAGPSAEKAQEWLAAVDATRNAFEEAIISARATQLVDGKEVGSADFDVYTKGRDRGLIVFKGGKNRGRKILTVGDRMWLIVPGATNPLPITPNQRLLGGASVSDVARLRFAQDYTATVRAETETVGERTCRVLDLTAKSPHAAYPRVVLWYDEAEGLPARLVCSLPSGLEAKDVTFTRFDKSHGKTIVSEMEVRDLLARGSKTVTRLEYRDYRPAKLDDRIFTPDGARAI